MVLLNILQNTDGTLAWDNLLILVLAVMAGYFLHRFGVKKIENKRYLKSLAEWESKCKRVENEYKNYKASITGSEKHHEKLVVDLHNAGGVGAAQVAFPATETVRTRRTRGNRHGGSLVVVAVSCIEATGRLRTHRQGPAVRTVGVGIIDVRRDQKLLLPHRRNGRGRGSGGDGLGGCA